MASLLRNPETIRRRLHCEPGQQLALLTMGGVCSQGGEDLALNPLMQRRDMVFVRPRRQGPDEFVDNLRFLSPPIPWHHPDLVAGADLVVGKATRPWPRPTITARPPTGYVPRPGFRESATLEAFLDSRLLSWKIEERRLQSGEWLADMPPLPTVKPPPGRKANGADQAAGYVVALLAQDFGCRTSK